MAVSMKNNGKAIKKEKVIYYCHMTTSRKESELKNLSDCPPLILWI